MYFYVSIAGLSYFLYVLHKGYEINPLLSGNVIVLITDLSYLSSIRVWE